MISFVLFVMLCDPQHSNCQLAQMPVRYQAEDDCKTWGKNNVLLSKKNPESGLVADSFVCLIQG